MRACESRSSHERAAETVATWAHRQVTLASGGPLTPPLAVLHASAPRKERSWALIPGMFSHAEWIQLCVCNGIKCTTNNCFLQIMLLFPSGWLINSVRADLFSVLLITGVNGVIYRPFPPQELGIHSLAAGCVAC